MKIGKRVNAKKYAKLRSKQAQANKMLYKSAHIEKGHTARKNVLKMKAQFFHSRGLKNPSMLSFKSLSVKDLKAYENMLDSIINNSYVNPEKYEKMLETQKQNFENKGYENIDFDSWITIVESDVFKVLKELAVDPSEMQKTLDEYSYYGLDEEDFLSMLRSFTDDMGAGEWTADDFFVYADEYLDKWL